MRLVWAAMLVLPLLAGCSGDEGFRLEAYEAHYSIPTGLEISVLFGEVVTFLSADGSMQEGYLLQVQYSAPGDRLGYDQTILDADLRPVRHLQCTDWFGGTCTRRNYDWIDAPEDLPGTIQRLFVPGDDPAPTDDGPDGEHTGVATFDGKLAPTSFPYESGEARRISYTALGPLAPLATGPAPALSFKPVTGPGLPGNEASLPGVPYSLAEALAFIEADMPEAQAILAGGGCVKSFSVLEHHADESPPPTVLTMDDEEGRFRLVLGNASAARAFTLEYGRNAPQGERGFLRTMWGGAEGGPIDCSQRGGVASLPSLLSLLDTLFPDHGLVAGAWTEDDGRLRLMLSTQDAYPFTSQRLSLAGDQGLSRWTQPSRDIDS